MELNQKKCWQLVAGLFCLIFLGQILLTIPTIRKVLVLTDTYEGKPAEFYRAFK